MSDLRMAIIAATGTARKRLIPAVRERNLCAMRECCQFVRITTVNPYFVFVPPAVVAACISAFSQPESGLYSFMALASSAVFLPRSFW